jgi:xylulokinase
MAMTTAGRPAGGPLYIGLDSSTQSLTAIVIEVGRDPRRPAIVLETSIAYDEALPHYGTRHGVLPSDDPAVAMSPPVMWAEALDLLFAQLATRLDLRQVAAISGSASNTAASIWRRETMRLSSSIRHSLLPARSSHCCLA